MRNEEIVREIRDCEGVDDEIKQAVCSDWGEEEGRCVHGKAEADKKGK